MKQKFGPLPDEICDQHLVVLGKTGSGKSSALRFIVEKLLKEKKRVCVVDPKGDWWGVKSSADGKSAGFPVIAFGDFKEQKASDVPINQHSGRHIAELVTSGNRPCVIGFRGWMTAHMVQFWIDFASGIFNANSGELYIVGDEFHNFAPKGKIMDPQAGKCLHWSNRLMSEGRGLGIVCLIASQRPQKVHNDTLTSCETLIAMRVIHKADRNAVQDWIEGCGDGEKGGEVLNALAGMPRGEAYVWSPEISFGPKRIAIPFFETFDSFAPPQTQRKISASGWADVDLSAVKEKLATVIDEAKANDPAELKKQIAALQKELRHAPAAKPLPPVAPVEIKVPVVTQEEIRQLDEAAHKCEMFEGEFKSYWQTLFKINERLAALKNAPRQSSPVIRLPQVPERITQHVAKRAEGIREAEAGRGNGELTGGRRQLMIAISQYPEGVNPSTLKVLTGYKSTSVRVYTGALMTDGYATRNGETLFPTESGIAALGDDYEVLPTGEALIEHWSKRLSGGEKEIFDYIRAVHPRGVTKDEIQDACQYKATSVRVYTGALKCRKVIRESGKELFLAEEME